MLGPVLPAHLDLAARNARGLAIHGRSLGRNADASERIARAWPHYRVLNPQGASGARAEKEALKTFRHIDPQGSPEWPTEVAARWLHAFVSGVKPFGPDAEMKRALSVATEPTTKSLTEFVTSTFATTRPYVFQHADALWLLEAFLGTDVVAAEVARVIASSNDDPWGFTNPNQRAIGVLGAYGWVLLRATPSVIEAAIAAIRARRRQVTCITPFTRAVDFLLGDAEPDVADEAESKQLVVHASESLARARIALPWVLYVTSPQDTWATGVAPHARALARLPAEPRWLMGQLVQAWEPFAHPFADAVRDAEASQPKKLSKKQLDGEVAALFEQLVAELTAVRGNETKETEAFARAAVELATLRARAGDPTPDQHLVHILGVDGWTKRVKAPMVRLEATASELDRWCAAVNAALA